MTFDDLLSKAKINLALNSLIAMYRPLLIKASIIHGHFDEDLYQELIYVLIRCVQTFQ